MIIEEGIEKPESGHEITSFLFNKGIISENLFSRLEGVVGFRNILVHEYGKIDHKRIYQYLAVRSKLTYVQSMQIAYLYVLTGEKDRALEWLEKAYEERYPFFVNLRVKVGLDNLRDDPRFQDLLRRMNYPE